MRTHSQLAFTIVIFAAESTRDCGGDSLTWRVTRRILVANEIGSSPPHRSPESQMTTPKVVFAIGREERPVIFTFAPLAAMRLSAILDQHGFRGVICDANVHKDNFPPAIEAELRDATALVIIGKIGRQLEDLIVATQVAKRVRADLPVIFSGWQASMAPEANLGEPTLDICTVGTAEHTLPELIGALAGGGELSAIAGLAYKKNGGIVRTAPRPVDKSLDDFPNGWDQVDLEWYITRDGGRCEQMVTGYDRCLNYTSSRGCHGQCGFCHITALFERGWFGHSVERVLDDVEYLARERRVDGIDFHDSNFFTNKPRGRRILQGFIDRQLNVVWRSSVRIDQMLAYEPEMLELMRDSGCKELAIGGESGSDRIMKLICKDIAPQDVIACSKRVREYGIAPVYSIMVGFPDEKNWSDTKLTLRHMAELKKLAPDAGMSYFYYTPFPSTPLFAWAEQHGLKDAVRLSDFALYSPYDPNMPWVDDKLAELLKMATRFYFKFAIPDAVMRERLRSHKLRLPLRALAALSRWRVFKMHYGFPFEYRLARFLKDTVIGKWGLFGRLKEIL
jgi:radical SAM superfamily enzyme YgiQ (UPF0313 family)